MIAIDTDVRGIYHVFKQDSRYPVTASFMHQSEQAERGVPIFSLLELCGLISTARQSEEAMEIFETYLTSESIDVLYPPLDLNSVEVFWARQNAELLKRIERKIRLGDAAILWTVETHPCDALITWNTKHYEGKTTLPIQAPDKWLTDHGYSPEG